MSEREVTDDLEQIALRAMAIIVPCGDARNKVRRALDLAYQGDEAAAVESLDAAREKLKEAHQAQTDIVQGEASGERQSYSVLFTHAQDILMTAMSEESLARQLVGYAASVEQRLAEVERRLGMGGEEQAG